jgi:nucleoside-diphosphate-sugar epimerase
MTAGAVAVTGASGFIGSAFVRRFAERGRVVHGLDLAPSGAAAVQATGGRFVTGAVTDADAVRRLLEGCDVVVHTAAMVAESGHWPDFVRVNAHAPRDVALAARAAGVRSVVHLSSVMVHGFDYPDGVGEDGPLDPAGNPYCWTKILSERAVLPLHERGVLDVYVVRPGDVYGPGSVPWTLRPVRHLRSRTFLYVDPEHALVNHVYVENLLDAVERMLAKGAAGRPHTVTDGVRTLAHDFFGHYQRMLGVRWVPSLSAEAALTMARAGRGLPRRWRDALDLERESIRYLMRRGQYATARVRDLGWSPRVDLEEGMARTESWLASQGLLAR